MKPGCYYFREWPESGLPHWCCTEWHTCTAMGDECKSYTPKIEPEKIRECEKLPRDDNTDSR
jgi:hypothetical protein